MLFRSGSQTGWLLGAGLTLHYNGTFSGLGAGLTLGRFSAAVPSDFGAEAPTGSQTPADVRSMRVGPRYVRGYPLAGPLSSVFASELGYFRETYDLGEINREFVDEGFMLLFQGDLGVRIAPGFHASLGLQVTLLIGDVMRYDFAAPLTLAGYL